MPEARVRRKTHKFGPNQHRSHPPARRANTRAAPRPLPGGSRRGEPGGFGGKDGCSASGPVSPPQIPIPIHVSHPHPCAAERAAAPPRVRQASCAWGEPQTEPKPLPTPPPETKTHGDGGVVGVGGGAAGTTASPRGLWMRLGLVAELPRMTQPPLVPKKSPTRSSGWRGGTHGGPATHGPKLLCPPPGH